MNELNKYGAEAPQPMLKKYTPFKPAEIGTDPLEGMRKRVAGSATASGFNPPKDASLDILSTNVSLSSTG